MPEPNVQNVRRKRQRASWLLRILILFIVGGIVLVGVVFAATYFIAEDPDVDLNARALAPPVTQATRA